MSVYALTSISGSPGVTTTAVAWAYLSPTPTLIVEADPTGGSPILAGVMRGEQPPDVSIIDLVGQPVDGERQAGRRAAPHRARHPRRHRSVCVHCGDLQLMRANAEVCRRTR